MNKTVKIVGGVILILLLMVACSAAISDSTKKEEKVSVEKVKKPKKLIKKAKPMNIKTDFDTCKELNKVYPDGVDKKHPAYKKNMDRNKDGFACEK